MLFRFYCAIASCVAIALILTPSLFEDLWARQHDSSPRLMTVASQSENAGPVAKDSVYGVRPVSFLTAPEDGSLEFILEEMVKGRWGFAPFDIDFDVFSDLDLRSYPFPPGIFGGPVLDRSFLGISGAARIPASPLVSGLSFSRAASGGAVFAAVLGGGGSSAGGATGSNSKQAADNAAGGESTAEDPNGFLEETDAIVQSSFVAAVVAPVPLSGSLPFFFAGLLAFWAMRKRFA